MRKRVSSVAKSRGLSTRKGKQCHCNQSPSLGAWGTSPPYGETCNTMLRALLFVLWPQRPFILRSRSVLALQWNKASSSLCLPGQDASRQMCPELFMALGGTIQLKMSELAWSPCTWKTARMVPAGEGGGAAVGALWSG